MAENSAQERTEDATEKRLKDSRDKGQVPRSKDLNTFAVVLSGAVVLFVGGQPMLADSIELFRSQFSLSRAEIFDPNTPVDHLAETLFSGFVSVSPIFGITVIAAFISSIAISGWLFTAKGFAPKFSRLDPIKGIARIFSVRGLIELIKALLKVTLILGVATFLFSMYLDEFVDLNREPLLPAIGHSAKMVGHSFIVLSASLFVIVLVDVPYQLWEHKRQLKMTRQEVKDESKERDGNPQIKSRIRSVQMEMAQRRMMENVPDADVIVTNPTHYAVALRYEADKPNAPRVVAKGKDIIAAQIRTIAKGSGVPLVSAPPLARALYFSVKLDAEIPEELYLAVAQILAYVYQLNDASVTGSDYPGPPKDLPVPEKLTHPRDKHE